MFTDANFALYAIFNNYEQYCENARCEGKEPVSLFQFTFGDF